MVRLNSPTRQTSVGRQKANSIAPIPKNLHVRFDLKRSLTGAGLARFSRGQPGAAAKVHSDQIIWAFCESEQNSKQRIRTIQFTKKRRPMRRLRTLNERRQKPTDSHY